MLALWQMYRLLPRPLKIVMRFACLAVVIMSFVHAYYALHNHMEEPKHVHTRRSTR